MLIQSHSTEFKNIH